MYLAHVEAKLFRFFHLSTGELFSLWFIWLGGSGLDEPSGAKIPFAKFPSRFLRILVDSGGRERGEFGLTFCMGQRWRRFFESRVMGVVGV